MTKQQLEAVIAKQGEQSKKLKKYVNLLKDAIDLLNGNGLIIPSKKKSINTKFTNYVNEGADLNKQINILESELSALQSIKQEEQPRKESWRDFTMTDKLKEEYVPYFGWCDVSGCKEEGCSGGIAWRETGYWTVCSKHASSDRNGDTQPKMKQSAIKREKGRDKITGYLSK